MTTQAYTISQQASAERLLADSLIWVRGRRKADGVSFVVFPSSNGRSAYYASLLNGGACTCRGFLHRGRCSHELALKRDAEQAREVATKPKRRGYADLFPEHEDAF